MTASLSKKISLKGLRKRNDLLTPILHQYSGYKWREVLARSLGATFDQLNSFQIAKIMPLVEAASDLMLAIVLCADENRRRLEQLLGQDSFGEVLVDETQQA
jgi:hypothetical protein